MFAYHTSYLISDYVNSTPIFNSAPIRSDNFLSPYSSALDKVYALS